MEEFNKVIAQNLVALRSQSKMTQIELAEKLNYSDKTISKWETGESVPSVENLMSIAAIYGVSMDDIVKEGGIESHVKSVDTMRASKTAITLLAVAAIWFAATILFVTFEIIYNRAFWQLFVYAVPFSFIVLLIFNCIWGKNKRLNYLVLSFICWTLLASIYIALLEYNIYICFLLGVPIQIIIIIWSNIKKKIKK